MNLQEVFEYLEKVIVYSKLLNPAMRNITIPISWSNYHQMVQYKFPNADNKYYTLGFTYWYTDEMNVLVTIVPAQAHYD